MPVFKPFDQDDIVRANPSEVTFGIWTGDTGSLAKFFTGPESASLSGQYYWNVYDINTSSSLAEIQFAVAYGNRLGGGNFTLNEDDNATLSTLATYAQYRNLLLEPDEPQFVFYNAAASDQIYVINVARARLKETLDPGNWQLALKAAGSTYTFIDDSGQTLGASFGKTGTVFNVVLGTLTGPSGSTITSYTASNGQGFGLVYPELGIIVLNPAAISVQIGMTGGSYASTPTAAFSASTATGATAYNHVGLLNAIKNGGDFQARSAETISSTHYFVRLRNKEFNYSNNPTFYDQTNGTVINSTFINDPKVYVTTVGLYSSENELLAVAKTSQPIQKSFDKELLLRVRLDW